MSRKSIVILLVLFILSLILLPNRIYATDDVITGGQNFIQTGQGGGSPIKEDDLRDVSNTIYNILLAAGVVIAVLVGAVLGIQFMMGSMEEQAKVKESLIPFVIGCVIVFSAFGIWKLVATAAQTL